MTESFTSELAIHLRAGYPLVFVLSQEEGRALGIACDVSSRDQIDAAIEADVARLAGGETLESPSGAFCPACGAPADAGDRFCGKCGASLRG